MVNMRCSEACGQILYIKKFLKIKRFPRRKSKVLNHTAMMLIICAHSFAFGQNSSTETIKKNLYEMEVADAVKRDPEVLAKFYSSYLKGVKNHLTASSSQFSNWDPTSEIDNAIRSNDLRKMARAAQGISVGADVFGVSISTSLDTPLNSLIAVFGKNESNSNEVIADFYSKNIEMVPSLARSVYEAQAKGNKASFSEKLIKESWNKATAGMAVCPPDKVISCSPNAQVLLGIDDIKRQLLAKGDIPALIKNFNAEKNKNKILFEDSIVNELSPVLISSGGINITTTQGDIKEFVAKKIKEQPSLRSKYNDIAIVKKDYIEQYKGTPEYKIGKIKENIANAKAYASAAYDISTVLFPGNKDIGEVFSATNSALTFAASAAEMYFTPNPAAFASAVSSGISLASGLFGKKKSSESGMSKALNTILENQRKMMQSLMRIESEIANTQRKIDNLSSDTWLIYSKLSDKFDQISGKIDNSTDNIILELDRLRAIADNTYELSKTSLNKMVELDYNDNIQSLTAFIDNNKTYSSFDKQFAGRINQAKNFNIIAQMGYQWSKDQPFVDKSIKNFISRGGLLKYEVKDYDVGILNQWSSMFAGELGEPANPSALERSIRDYFVYAYQIPESFLNHSRNWSLLKKQVKESINMEDALIKNIPASYEKTIVNAKKIDNFFNVKIPNLLRELDKGYLFSNTESLIELVNPIALQSDTYSNSKVSLKRTAKGLSIAPLIEEKSTDSVYLERRQARYLESLGVLNRRLEVVGLEVGKTYARNPDFLELGGVVLVCFKIEDKGYFKDRFGEDYGVTFESSNAIIYDSYKLCQTDNAKNLEDAILYDADVVDSAGRIIYKGSNTYVSFRDPNFKRIGINDPQGGAYIFNYMYGIDNVKNYDAQMLKKEDWESRSDFKVIQKVNGIFSKLASEHPKKAMTALENMYDAGQFDKEMSILSDLDTSISLLKVGISRAFPNCELALYKRLGMIYAKPSPQTSIVSGRYYPKVSKSSSDDSWPEDYISLDEVIDLNHPSLKDSFIHYVKTGNSSRLYKMSLYINLLGTEIQKWNDMKARFKISSQYCSSGRRTPQIFKMMNAISSEFADFK